MTSYQKIYDRFERLIVDYDLNELLPTTKAEVELGFLQSAITYYFTSSKDLSNRDDVNLTFNFDLTELEQEILANYMVVAWIQPYMNSQDLFEQHFITSEYKAFSSANKINALEKAYNMANKNASVLATKNSIKNIAGGLK